MRWKSLMKQSQAKIFFSTSGLTKMWLNKESRIAKLLILTGSPGPMALHPLQRMR